MQKLRLFGTLGNRPPVNRCLHMNMQKSRLFGTLGNRPPVNRSVCTWTCRNHDCSGHWVNDLQKVCLCMKELRQFLADVFKRPSTDTSVHEYACAWRNHNIYQCSGITTFINVQDRDNDLQIICVCTCRNHSCSGHWVNDLQKVCLCLKKTTTVLDRCN